MSGRRRLERQMARDGQRVGGAMVSTTEVRAEAMALVEKLLPVLFQTKPVAPLVCLLALEVARRHIVAVVDESALPAEDKQNFWEGVESEMKAYDAAIAARRS